MNDEYLLLDEMNDFENFMENADVEEIKKEHGLTTFECFPPFKVGPFYNTIIDKVTKDHVYIVSIITGKSSGYFKFCDSLGEFLSLCQLHYDHLGLDCDYINENGEFLIRMPKDEVVQGDIIESPQDIHQRICNNFDIVEKTLYEICVDLKTIRDNKFYKQLGYDTFEAYCLENFNIKRSYASKYISIANNLSSEFVSTSKQTSVEKLYILSRLTDDERTELLESTDIEHTPVKQVEQKAKEIKQAREVQSNFLKSGDYGYFQIECLVENGIKKANISLLTELEDILVDDKGEYIVQSFDFIEELPFDFLELDNYNNNSCLAKYYQKDFEKILDYYNSQEVISNDSTLLDSTLTESKFVKLNYSTIEFIYTTLMKSKSALLFDNFDKGSIAESLESVCNMLVKQFPKLYK